MSSIIKSTSTPPGACSPQLDQLLPDLEEIQFKLRPDTFDPPQNPESSDGNPEDDQIHEFEDLSPEDQCPPEDIDTARVSIPSAIQLAEDISHTHVEVTEPVHFQTSTQNEPEIVTVSPDHTKTSETGLPSSLGSCNDSPVFPTDTLSNPESLQRLFEVMEPSLNLNVCQSYKYDESTTETFSPVSFHKVATETEEHLANLHEEDSTTGIPQSREQLESAVSSHDSRDVIYEILTQGTQDYLTYLCEGTCVESTQGDDLFSQSLSDLTPETVKSVRHFSFEDLMPYSSSGNLEASSDEDRGQPSEEFFASQPTSITKAELTTSDEGYSIPPGYAETHSTSVIYDNMPPEYTTVVHRGADSPISEYSDPDPYFDCKQAASDFSETEPDAPERSVTSCGSQSHDHVSHPRVPEKVNPQVVLSCGSEDYEDAAFVQEPLDNANEEDDYYSESSDEEFTMCEASQLPPASEFGTCDDTDKYLTREITAELGSMSESSDDEFMTTRVVRRRVVIQADEMPDFPAQSVTEEKYKDENGHIVVKKVTRKIIRKCVSADGVEHEQVSSEGDPQGSLIMAEGAGYSRVVKRTVLKSDGDHTEVTFTGCEGPSAPRQETAEACKVSCMERTTEVEGKRTMTHQGDPSLASDLPSAQDDFKQALGYISGFSRAKLPHVVEKETVKEDGTVVRRAHMRKGCTLRRTVVKEAGQRKQVLLEQRDSSRKGPKPRDLQKHLQQLFHRYYKEEEEDNDEDEEEEEE